MNFINTKQGTFMEKFYPEGWDLAKIDHICSHPAAAIMERQPLASRFFTCYV